MNEKLNRETTKTTGDSHHLENGIMEQYNQIITEKFYKTIADGEKKLVCLCGQ